MNLISSAYAFLFLFFRRLTHRVTPRIKNLFPVAVIGEVHDPLIALRLDKVGDGSRLGLREGLRARICLDAGEPRAALGMQHARITEMEAEIPVEIDAVTRLDESA